MIFEENYFFCYILLTPQIPLSGCLYIVRYWAICIEIVCERGCDVINFEIKGRLSAQMTWQFLNALELFSPYKSKLSNFRFCLIFIFNKKQSQSCEFATYWRKNSTKVVNLPLPDEKLCSSFWRHKQVNGFYHFQRYH